EKVQNCYKDDIEIVLGYGAYHKRPGLLNKLIRFESFHTGLQYLSYALAGIPYMGVGRNLSYKKDLFLRNKGFSSINHIPSGDDDLFINKVATGKNTAVIIDPEAITRSNPKRTWRDWRKQKARHYTTAKFYKRKHKFLLGLYTATQFLFYKAMRKMDEQDLWPSFLALDVWMFLYYIIFFSSLWRKPRKTWN